MASIEREVPRVLLVGEDNPRGSDPRMALFFLPREASGNRLRVVLGLSDVDYMRRCARVNLCAGRWSDREARERAQIIREANLARLAQIPWTGEVAILLGSKVRRALDGPPAFEVVIPERGPVLVGLPHPSGRCLVWNEPGARARAREACRRAAPWIPWGSAES